jgi:hypothetical protein
MKLATLLVATVTLRHRKVTMVQIRVVSFLSVTLLVVLQILNFFPAINSSTYLSEHALAATVSVTPSRSGDGAGPFFDNATYDANSNSSSFEIDID